MLFKKFPKFGKNEFGTAKVQLCHAVKWKSRRSELKWTFDCFVFLQKVFQGV
jgi:hypothetical protein